MVRGENIPPNMFQSSEINSELKSLHIQLVPRHKGIEGNELSDLLQIPHIL